MSLSKVANTPFPFVGFPDFQDVTKQALLRTSALAIRWNPLVKSSQMDEWKSFSGFAFETTEEKEEQFVANWQLAPSPSTVS